MRVSPVRLLLTLLGVVALAATWIFVTRLSDREPRIAAAPVQAETRALEPTEIGVDEIEPDARTVVELRHEDVLPPPPAPSASAPVKPAHVSIRGRLRDEDGNAWTEARVSIVARDARGKYHRPARSEVASFEFDGLAAGRYWVSTHAAGWKRQVQTVDLGSASDTDEIELVLSRSTTVRVRVRTPTGAGFVSEFQPFDFEHHLPDVRATVNRPTPESDAWDLENAGTFHRTSREELLESDLLGELELYEDLPLYATLRLGRRSMATQRVEPSAAEVVFVLDPVKYAAEHASLRFRVIDARTAKPIHQVAAALAMDGDETSYSVPILNGVAEYTTVVPGPGVLIVFPHEYPEVRRKLELSPGKNLDLGDIALEPLPKLPFRLVMPDGASHVRVRSRSKAAIDDPPPPGRLVFCRQNGLLLDNGPGFEWPIDSGETVIVADGKLDGVPLRSRPHVVDWATFSGELVLELEPTVSLVVRSSRPDETRWAAVSDPLAIEPSRPLSRGPARFDVLPGEERLVLESPGAREERTLEIGPGGLTIDLE